MLSLALRAEATMAPIDLADKSQSAAVALAQKRRLTLAELLYRDGLVGLFLQACELQKPLDVLGTRLGSNRADTPSCVSVPVVRNGKILVCMTTDQ